MNNEEKILSLLETLIIEQKQTNIRLDKLEEGQRQTNIRLDKLEEGQIKIKQGSDFIYDVVIKLDELTESRYRDIVKRLEEIGKSIDEINDTTYMLEQLSGKNAFDIGRLKAAKN